MRSFGSKAANRLPGSTANAAAPESPTSKSPTDAGRPHLLPADLPNALKWLATEELATLAAAVVAEQQRRSPLEQEQAAMMAVPAASSRELKGETNVPGLTKSQVSAIRASFKAGVRPAAIGRQFGVSQAAVRAALATAKYSPTKSSRRFSGGQRCV